MTTVRRFIEAICPEAPDLYLASFNEMKALTDATEIITDLRRQLADRDSARVERSPYPAKNPGYMIVPIEPTEAMLKAGGHVNSEWLDDYAPLNEAKYTRPMEGVWKAMVHAGPDVGTTGTESQGREQVLYGLLLEAKSALLRRPMSMRVHTDESLIAIINALPEPGVPPKRREHGSHGTTGGPEGEGP